MIFIDELCVRRAVQRASGHGFLVGYFSMLIGSGLWIKGHPILGLCFVVTVLTPLLLFKAAYLDWQVKKAKEDVR